MKLLGVKKDFSYVDGYIDVTLMWRDREWERIVVSFEDNKEWVCMNEQIEAIRHSFTDI